MDAPKLTPLERLNLANQYRILAGQDGENADDYAYKAEILLEGHTALYHRVFNELAEEIPVSVCEEALNFADMFNGIHYAINELNPDERAQLDMSRLVFEGFDATRDAGHYNHLVFLVNQENLLSELRGKNLDSHSQLALIRYRRMYPVYMEALNRSKTGIDLAYLLQLQAF